MFKGNRAPVTIGSIHKLYVKAQPMFMLIKVFALFKNLMNASILWRFYERMTTSAALMLSYDLALMLIPIPASCRQGISLSPSPIMMATF